MDHSAAKTEQTGSAYTLLVSQPHGMAIEDVVETLSTDLGKGLTGEEAIRRLVHVGPNELPIGPKVPEWRRFLAQFTDTLVILLLVAGSISALLWYLEGFTPLPYETVAILVIVILNAAMGYFQQARAAKAVEALRRLSAPQATVIREGERQRVASHVLVPGDIIRLEEGDRVPADARIAEAISLATGEATLTGESLPVEKNANPIEPDAALGDRRNMVFMGTIVLSGRACALVTATGLQTEAGRIADMLSSTRENPTPLQLELDSVGRTIGWGVLIVAATLIIAILLTSEIDNLSKMFELFVFGVALAVAAVPEGLPAIVTAVLSLGVQRMAKKNAIVRRMSAVEALGSADVIASDKTGTLTKNEMTVRRIVTASGSIRLTGTGYLPMGECMLEPKPGVDAAELVAELNSVLTAAERANNARLHELNGDWIVQGDPTEGALMVAARKAGLDIPMLDRCFARIGEIPFSSERKLMSTIYSGGEHQGYVRLFTKGAPDVLLERCTSEFVGGKVSAITPARKCEIMAANEDLASDALRTLAVAVRDVPLALWKEKCSSPDLEQELVFLGLAGMLDPPRDEARQAVAVAKAAGIRTIMITGDHPITAAAIAAELDLTKDLQTLTGAQLQKMSINEFDYAVRLVSVYARVEPAHKLRIVEALRRQGETVAMTGDGINDAPALKAADIGIAMGVSGTDVSKEAADIVLADDNFATIVSAVGEGRAIFSNIQKFLRYLLSSNIGEVATMVLGVLLGDLIGLVDANGGIVLPLLATQILWINLVTDGPPALALGVDEASADIMRRPPRRRGERVVTGSMWGGIFLVGAVMAIGTLGVLDAALPGGLIAGTGSVPYAQTMAFTTLTLFQLFNVFNARSDEMSAFSGLFSNRWLWGAVGLSLLLHMAVIYSPFLQRAFSTVSLGWSDWLVCISVASTVVVARETSKALHRLGSFRTSGALQ